jgi:hypothetical protein
MLLFPVLNAVIWSKTLTNFFSQRPRKMKGHESEKSRNIKTTTRSNLFIFSFFISSKKELHSLLIIVCRCCCFQSRLTPRKKNKRRCKVCVRRVCVTGLSVSGRSSRTSRKEREVVAAMMDEVTARARARQTE